MILVLAETNFNNYDDSDMHQPNQCCLGIFRCIDDAEIAKQHYAEKVLQLFERRYDEDFDKDEVMKLIDSFVDMYDIEDSKEYPVKLRPDKFPEKYDFSLISDFYI